MAAIQQTATLAMQQAVAASKDNKQITFVGFTFFAKKSSNMSLSCKYRCGFTTPVKSISQRSLLEPVAASSHDEGLVKTKEDQNVLDSSFPLNSGEIIERLKLHKHLEEIELHNHLVGLGDIVSELRLNFDYKYKDGKYILVSTPIHGIWKSHIKNGRVVSDLDEENYSKTIDLAKKLSDVAHGIPTLLPKLKTMWKPTNHTITTQELVAHEMAKHGFLSPWYAVVALEAARPFFDENGSSILLKIMEEMGYVQGIFNCFQFQKDFTKRFGCKILTTYEDKVKDRLYPKELGILFGRDFTRMDYLFPKGVGCPDPTNEFFLDGIDGSGTM